MNISFFFVFVYLVAKLPLTVSTISNKRSLGNDESIDNNKKKRSISKSIPKEKNDQALENAGYVDGTKSIARLKAWIDRIDGELMPQYQKKDSSKRRDQYIRWLTSAKETFTQAIEMGGELSYYKHARRERRTSLEQLELSAKE